MRVRASLISLLCLSTKQAPPWDLESGGKAVAITALARMGRKPKLTEYRHKEALRRRAAGEPVRELARTFNVSHSTISRLKA